MTTTERLEADDGTAHFSEDPEALRDYWKVYTDHYEQITTETTARIAGHPVFGPLIAAISKEQRDAQSAQSRVLTAAAIEGAWAPYAASLEAQGAFYAGMGLTFDSWYDVLRAYSGVVVPLIVTAYASEPARVARVIVAMQDFLDRAMSVIAKSYIDAKQRALDEQCALAERRAEQLEASEKSLRRQTSILGAVLDSMRDGVVVSDASGQVVLRNKAARYLTASSNDGGADVEVCDYATGERVPPEQFPVSRAARGEQFDDVELRVSAANGADVKILSCRGGPVAGTSDLAGGVVSFRDVTEKKRLLAMQSRSRELEEENRQFEEANRLKSEFLASMSHELRTPLNAIIGFGELLFDGVVDPASPDYREFLGNILGSGRHLLQLINDILDLSKVEAGKMDFRPEPTDVGLLGHDIAGILRSQAAGRRIRIDVEADDSLGEVVIDPGRLKQVLYNYLSNALKFSPEAGRVLLRIRPENDRMFRIEVEDSGEGISPEDISKLFVEFQQLESGTSKRHGGTGLGLALTKRLVEAQGGLVGVESTPGKGSVFYAVLPRRSSVQTSLPDRVVRSGLRPESPRILVIEDDPRDQEYLVRSLSAAGYAVETASTGAQALESLRSRSFDAVTLDLVLPDTSGLDILRAIRTGENNSTIPVLIVSVTADRTSAAGFAVHDFLQKPVEAPMVLQSLARAGVKADVGHVLVVDDDPSALRLMTATLTQLGYRSICEQDPERALDEANRERPSAVILDLLMPKMDGFEFLDHFRRVPDHRETPVIIWTVKELSSAEHARLRSVSDAIVRKGGANPLLEDLRVHLPARRATARR